MQSRPESRFGKAMARAAPPADSTFAMRKRIADMIWQARQRQMAAGFLLMMALLAVLPTLRAPEWDASLPNWNVSQPYLASEPVGKALTEPYELQARLWRESDRAVTKAEMSDYLSAEDRDKVHFVMAQLARAHGKPRLVAAELQAMQGAWTELADPSDGRVMRGLIDFVRANDLTMPLPQAERLASPPAKAATANGEARRNRNLAQAMGFGLLALFAAAVSLIAGLRMARIGKDFLLQAQRLG